MDLYYTIYACIHPTEINHMCVVCDKLISQPDIAAPGVDILASYTLLKSLTGLAGDTQFSKFTLMSGTSMSCPHVAGIAAYIKSFHPEWSPAAIRSAIITTGNLFIIKYIFSHNML